MTSVILNDIITCSPVCQRSKATRAAMSRLSERHILKTKYAKLLTVPTRGCSTVASPSQYQLSRATVQPQKHVRHPQQLFHTRDISSHILVPFAT